MCITGCLRYNELNQQPEKHEPKVVDGRKTFQRFLKFCNDLPHGVDYEGYFSGWFKGAPFKDIKRGEQQRQQHQLAEQGALYAEPMQLSHRSAMCSWGILPCRNMLSPTMGGTHPDVQLSVFPADNAEDFMAYGFWYRTR